MTPLPLPLLLLFTLSTLLSPPPLAHAESLREALRARAGERSASRAKVFEAGSSSTSVQDALRLFHGKAGFPENNGICTVTTSSDVTRTYAQWSDTFLSNSANGIQELTLWGLGFHPTRLELASSYQGFANWDNKPKFAVWDFDTTSSRITSPLYEWTSEYGLGNLDYVLDGKGLAVVKDSRTVTVVWPGIPTPLLAPVSCTGSPVSSQARTVLASSRGAGGTIIHCGASGAANIFEVASTDKSGSNYTCTLVRRLDSKRVDACSLYDDRMAATVDSALYETRDPSFTIWDVATGDVVADRVLPSGITYPSTIEMLDESYVYVGMANGSTVLYDLRNPYYALELASSHGPPRYNVAPIIRSIRVHPSKCYVATAGMTTVKVHRVNPARALSCLAFAYSSTECDKSCLKYGTPAVDCGYVNLARYSDFCICQADGCNCNSNSDCNSGYCSTLPSGSRACEPNLCQSKCDNSPNPSYKRAVSWSGDGKLLALDDMLADNVGPTRIRVFDFNPVDDDDDDGACLFPNDP